MLDTKILTSVDDENYSHCVPLLQGTDIYQVRRHLGVAVRIYGLSMYAHINRITKRSFVWLRSLYHVPLGSISTRTGDRES